RGHTAILQWRRFSFEIKQELLVGNDLELMWERGGKGGRRNRCSHQRASINVFCYPEPVLMEVQLNQVFHCWWYRLRYRLLARMSSVKIDGFDCGPVSIVQSS
ncbi:5856_t:CDS:1, partial [Acaulospora colombiana]